MSADRRGDGEDRDRIDELVRGFEQDRNDLRRAVKRITAAVVGVAIAVGLGFAGDAHERGTLRHEGDTRKDQTCLLFERQHAKDVRQLVQLYRYLKGLKPEQRTEGINPAVIASLPQTEDDARLSMAPRYCDAPGVGLPEPNPRIPSRPPGLVPLPKGALRWAGRT